MNQDEFFSLTIEEMLDKAFCDLEYALQSLGSLFVLWGSFSSEDDLRKNYLNAKGKSYLLDRRRTAKSLSDQDINLINAIDEAVADAHRYHQHLTDTERQPLMRNLVVQYSSAVEDFLKRICIAQLLYDNEPSLNARVRQKNFNKAVKDATTSWRRAQNGGQSTARIFFTNHLHNGFPDETRWSVGTEDSDWEIIDSAFSIRNVIIHRCGRPNEIISLSHITFLPNQEVCITSTLIGEIRSAIDRLFLRGYDKFAIL